MESQEVVFVTSEFPPKGGGIGVYVSQLSKALRSLGWKCWVAVWGKKQSVNRSARVIQIPFLPLPPVGDFLFASSFRRIFRDLDLEDPVINVHSPYPQAALAPDIVTVHNVIRKQLSLGSFEGLKWLQYRLGFRVLVHNEKRLLRSPVVCTVSDAVVSELKQEYGLSRAVQVVGNAVDDRRFVPGVKAPRPTVLYLGRLDVNKGVMGFVQMAKLVHERCPTAEFRIVGDGPARLPLARAIRDLHLESCATMVGYIPPSAKLVEEYQRAWVYVLPSRLEGLPTTILEAMACGTPPVVRDIPNNREALSRKEGFLVDNDSPESYANPIAWALENSTELRKTGAAARARIVEQFTWEKVARKYDAVLRTIDRKAWQSTVMLHRA